MADYVLIVGLDEAESNAIRDLIDQPVIAHISLPKILIQDGQLFAESDRGPRMLPVSKVIYHGIYEDDMDFISALALWGGSCFPNPRAMMDCRLKLPCLVRALQYTRFGDPRGYASPYARFESDSERVAKWGNWHCGENKERFTGSWTAEQPSIVEPFLQGQAVRGVIIGERYWQIRLDGDDWLKSIHHAKAAMMEVDEELMCDTWQVKDGFGLEIIGNDYIIAEDGSKHLLEVNHIPNVTRFPEIWEAYRDFAVNWVQSKA